MTDAVDDVERGKHGQYLFRGCSPPSTFFSGIYFLSKHFLSYYFCYCPLCVETLSLLPFSLLSVLSPFLFFGMSEKKRKERKMLLPPLLTVCNLRNNPLTI